LALHAHREASGATQIEDGGQIHPSLNAVLRWRLEAGGFVAPAISHGRERKGNIRPAESH
jgi:hypothetical protein